MYYISNTYLMIVPQHRNSCVFFSFVFSRWAGVFGCQTPISVYTDLCLSSRPHSVTWKPWRSTAFQLHAFRVSSDPTFGPLTGALRSSQTAVHFCLSKLLALRDEVRSLNLRTFSLVSFIHKRVKRHLDGCG
jgi:hypothetical protein